MVPHRMERLANIGVGRSCRTRHTVTNVVNISLTGRRQRPDLERSRAPPSQEITQKLEGKGAARGYRHEDKEGKCGRLGAAAIRPRRRSGQRLNDAIQPDDYHLDPPRLPSPLPLPLPTP